jgi:pimeloyl-ACP methyl ester carboxylesterase
MLPLVIHEAAVGNFEPFLGLAVPEKAPRPISEPQYLSVVCPEETAFYTIEEAKAASKATLTGMSYADEFKLACRAWGMPAHPDYPLEWRSPDFPTLVISGDRDPITPVEYGQRIADSIPSARHLPIHHMPHDFSGLNHSDCLEAILLEFLETRTPAALNTGCISTMYAPSFYLELPEP